jgi:uncharacterized protein YxeA
MKKVFAVIAVALFVVGITAPVVAAVNRDMTVVAVSDDEPAKKAATDTQSDTEAAPETKAKSSDCSNHEKAEKSEAATKTKKNSDCAAPAEEGQSAKK